MGEKWYICTVNEIWIMERLSDAPYSDFEFRKYKADGSVYKEYFDWIDGVSYININRMKQMETM